MSLSKGFFLLGLLTGATTSALLAPQTGEELREKLKRERKAGGNGLEAMKEEFIEMGNEVTVLAQDYVESPHFQKHVATGKKHAMLIAKDAHKAAKPLSAQLVTRAKGMHKDYTKKATKTLNQLKKKLK